MVDNHQDTQDNRGRCFQAYLTVCILYISSGRARCSWLFADIPKGANASATVYSIVETAKANGLNVYPYLESLLLYMPDTDWQNDPDALDDLMPCTARCERMGVNLSLLLDSTKTRL